MAKLTLTYDGITDDCKGWAKRTGISEVTIRRRISYGWTPEQVLTTSTERKSWAETITFNGVTDTYAGWAKKMNISESALRCRLSKKRHVNEDSVWTIEDALTTPAKRSSWNNTQTQLKEQGLGKLTNTPHSSNDEDELAELMRIINKPEVGK